MPQNVIPFLSQLAQNNNRPWFQAHRADYEAVRATLEQMAARMISLIAEFDPDVAHLEPKQTLYRIYRDTRFSADKHPYKQWQGCFINPRGKKSLHGGYYFHLEPGNCMVAGGTYWCPSNVLTALRNSIFAEIDRYRSIVEAPAFKARFPRVGEDLLKTAPKGFPKDWPYIDYLRPRIFSVAASLPDDFFAAPDWAERLAADFRLMKPYMDFINETVDDYL